MKITLLTGKTFKLETAFDFPLMVTSAWKIKRLKIRICQKFRRVELYMPKLCPVHEAYMFVKNNQEWIEKQLSALPLQKDFENGDQISLCGRSITIFHQKDSLRAAEEKNGKLYIGGEKVFFHRRVKDYIKKEAQKYLFELSQVQANKINCRLMNVHLKDTRSRWGSCSSINNINYNWRIALAPLSVINYLVAHEVAHLRHPNHSVEFWKCVEMLYPKYMIGKEWLKQHGMELYHYK